MTIDSSLFIAGTDAGLSDAMIMELAGIFGGVIDFVLDPRLAIRSTSVRGAAARRRAI